MDRVIKMVPSPRPEAGLVEAIKTEKLLPIITALYAGVDEARPWSNFVQLLKAALPCDHVAMIQRWPSAGDSGASTASTPQAPNLAEPSGILARYFRELAPGVVHHLSSLLQLQQRPILVDASTGLRIADALGIDITDTENFTTVHLRCVRVAGQPVFDQTEREFLEQLIPSLTTAVGLQNTLTMQRFDLDDLDEQNCELQIGEFVIDRNFRIIQMVGAAKGMIGARDGLSVTNNILHCVDGDAQATFVHLVEETFSFGPNQESAFNPQILYLRRPSGNGYWSLAFRRRQTGGTGNAETPALVQVMTKNASYKPAITHQMLEEMFGLTPAEANIAQRLTDGQTLYEAADECGISHNTARVHLAAIFSKTYVNRQTQLVRLILSRLNSGWTIPRPAAAPETPPAAGG